MMHQTDEELAEMVARFRTPPGLNWEPLRDDILTIIMSIRAQEAAKPLLVLAPDAVQ